MLKVKFQSPLEFYTKFDVFRHDTLIYIYCDNPGL